MDCGVLDNKCLGDCFDLFIGCVWCFGRFGGSILIKVGWVLCEWVKIG